MPKGVIINIPIRMDFKIIDKKPVIVGAEYAEVEADSVARYLLDKFHIDVEAAEPV